APRLPTACDGSPAVVFGSANRRYRAGSRQPWPPRRRAIKAAAAGAALARDHDGINVLDMGLRASRRVRLAGKHMHHRRAGLALAIFAASALACPAAPLRPVGSRSSERADLYVSPAGSDTNPGTASSPLLTIIEASRLAEPGTTVHVAPGVYP